MKATKSEISQFADELFQHAEHLFQLGMDEKGECTALAYSKRLRKRNDYVEKLMNENGMSTRYDAVGNLFGRIEGQSPKTILILSHIDTVVNAGRFDGVLGVLLGVIACKKFEKNLPYSLEVLVCMGEESPGVTATFGSKCITGHYTEEDLKSIPLAYNPKVSVKDAIIEFFSNRIPEINSLKESQLNKDKYLNAIEIHTEQYYSLKWLSEKRNNIPQVGVMSGVGGHIRAWVSLSKSALENTKLTHYSIVKGQTGHSGATPMGAEYRDDALLKFSEIWLKSKSIQKLQNKAFGIEILPSSKTSIPKQVKLWHSELDNKIMDEMKGKFDALNIQADSSFYSNLSHQSINEIASVTKQLNKKVNNHEDDSLRGTVTMIDSNSLPKLFIDIRGGSDQAMNEVYENTLTDAGFKSNEAEIISKKSPSIFDKNQIQATEKIVSKALEGNIQKGNISVPGQDIGIINSYGIPSSLLFIESNTGHHPDEHVRKEAVEQAFKALIHYLNEYLKN